MSVNLFLLGLFNLLIVCYVTFLIQQAFSFKKRFGYLCEASGLGEVKNAQHKVYNFGYFLFGFMSIIFTNNLQKILISGVTTNIAIALMYVAGLALCAIAIFPRDTFHKEHTRASVVMFFCGVSFMVLLVDPFVKSPVIPKEIIPFNVLIPALLIYYLFLKIKYFKKYNSFDNGMERSVSIWEWIPFITTYLWYFSLTTLLISKLL